MSCSLVFLDVFQHCLLLRWGVDGYLVMPRDNTNRCGIYYQGSAVTFAGGLVSSQKTDPNTKNQDQNEDQPQQDDDTYGGYFYNLFHGF